MIRIVVDTASDITHDEAIKMGVSLVSLPVTFEDQSFEYENDKNFDRFYNLLQESKVLPKTSQPAPAQYLDIFMDAKEKNDDVLVITLSSGLSGTFESAQMAKSMSEYDRITIVDSNQATISLKMLIDYAINLRDEGKSIQEIESLLKSARDRIVVCALLDTLVYLEKGDRIPKALALVGTVLNIKPVIILRNKKLELLGKATGFEKGKKILYRELEKEELDDKWSVTFGYTTNKESGSRFMKETVEKYGLKNTCLRQVGSVIGTHVGTDCIAIAFARKK